MNIPTKTIDDVLILILSGRITMYNCEQVKTAFERYLHQGWSKLALDFTEVEFLDSAGLAVLIDVVRQTSREKAGLRFFGLRQRVMSMVEIANLHKVFPIAEDREQTLEQLSQANSQSAGAE